MHIDVRIDYNYRRFIYIDTTLSWVTDINYHNCQKLSGLSRFSKFNELCLGQSILIEVMPTL